MGLLDSLSPGQLQALKYGVPVVAGVAVVSKLRRKAPVPAQTAAPVTGFTAPSTDAIGVGQLSEFESSITDQLNQLAMIVNAGGDAAVATPPAPASPAPVSPAASPAAPAQPTNQYSIGQVVNPASGESIVANAYSSQYGWLDLTSKGGVYTSGGSQPIPGSYLGYVASLPGASQPAESQLHGDFTGGNISVLPGGGFVETNKNGEKYTFGTP
jgi:hypothetical protein